MVICRSTKRNLILSLSKDELAGRVNCPHANEKPDVVPMNSFPNHPFWDFSLRVYGGDGVAPACLRLQEKHGVDVNVLLHCCWLAVSGRGALEREQVVDLNEGVADWHAEIVRGLRAVRKRLKEPVGGENRELALSLRQRVQKLEIDSEHIEQLMLAATTDKIPTTSASSDAHEAANANVAAYLGAIGAAPDAEDQAAITTVVSAATNNAPPASDNKVQPENSTKDQAMIGLVKRYFAGVDDEDFASVSATLAENCIFTVETHGVRLQGHAEIEGMLTRLWGNHAAVRHQDFVFVPAPGDGRIAVSFAVVNTHHDGSVTHKSNCNFFEFADGRFTRVAVYMAGENTLNAA